jgi:hypothetical protein
MMLFVLVKTNDATIHQLLRVAQSNAEVGVRVDRAVRPHEWNIASVKGARHITPTRHKATPVSLARRGVA